MAKRSLSALIVATLIAGTAAAADAPKAPAGYVLTGETKHCLQTRRIDSLRIINESQILVEMSNGEAYLQQPRSCSKLRKSYAFVYEATMGTLCDTTTITLHDTTPDFGPTGVCIFDDFRKLEKQSAAAD